MANSNLDQQIRSRIEACLDEVTGLVRASALASVQEALGGNGVAAPRWRGPGRPRGSGRRAPGRPSRAASPASNGRRVRRSPKDLEQLGSQILTYVKANPGQRLEEIGVGLKTDTGVLKRPIANLLASRALRTEGQKRGTKYFAGDGRRRGRKAQRSGRARTRRKTARTRRSSRKQTTKRAKRSESTAAPAVSPP